MPFWKIPGRSNINNYTTNVVKGVELVYNGHRIDKFFPCVIINRRCEDFF